MYIYRKNGFLYNNSAISNACLFESIVDGFN